MRPLLGPRSLLVALALLTACTPKIRADERAEDEKPLVIGAAKGAEGYEVPPAPSTPPVPPPRAATGFSGPGHIGGLPTSTSATPGSPSAVAPSSALLTP